MRQGAVLPALMVLLVGATAMCADVFHPAWTLDKLMRSRPDILSVSSTALELRAKRLEWLSGTFWAQGQVQPFPGRPDLTISCMMSSVADRQAFYAQQLMDSPTASPNRPELEKDMESSRECIDVILILFSSHESDCNKDTLRSFACRIDGAALVEPTSVITLPIQQASTLYSRLIAVRFDAKAFPETLRRVDFLASCSQSPSDPPASWTWDLARTE